MSRPENRRVPVNFLLQCSQDELGKIQLARLTDVANLRIELQEIVDRMVDNLAQAAVAKWFRDADREALKQALETEESAIEWARRMVRGGGEILPRVRMSEEDARAHHVESTIRYKQNNIAAGKCKLCPKTLDRNSTQLCTKHLEQKNEWQREKSKKLGKAPHGRHPNTLASLARSREARSANKESPEESATDREE